MERRLEAIRTEKSKVPAELVPRDRQQDHRDATSLTKVRKYEASCSLVWDMEWFVWRAVQSHYNERSFERNRSHL